MGCFTLCVEATARDVNNLLELHKVHPQVRVDVKKQLNALIEKSYEHMVVSQPGYQESSEQVCSTIISELVHKALTTAIPRAELLIKEKENAALQQELLDLRAKTEEERQQCAEAVESLESFHAAHDYMLHSYFREVLVLRHRIQDLEKRSRTGRSISHSIVGAALPVPRAASRSSPAYSPTKSSLSATPTAEGGAATLGSAPMGGEPQPHAALLSSMVSSATEVPAFAVPKASVLGDVLAQMSDQLLSASPSAPPEERVKSAFARTMAPASATEAGAGSREAPEGGSSSPATCPAERAALADGDGSQPSTAHLPVNPLASLGEGGDPDEVAPSPDPPQTQEAPQLSEAPQPDSSPQAASPKSPRPVAQVVLPSPVQQSSPTVCGQRLAAPSSSVASLGSCNNAGRPSEVPAASPQEMLKALAAPREDESVDAIFDYEEYVALLNGGNSYLEEQRQHGYGGGPHSHRYRSRGKGGRGAGSRNAGNIYVEELERELDYYKTKASKVRWCLQFSVRPVKYELFNNLEEIRREFLAMKKTFTESLAKLSNIMTLLQSRSDALEEIFGLFTSEVVYILHCMKKDASSKSCAELFLNSGKHKNKLETIFAFDKETNAGHPDLVTSAGDDLTPHILRRFMPWQNHSVTIKARKTLSEMEKFADKMRQKRAFFLSKGGDGVEGNYRNLFHRSSHSRGSVTWAKSLESDEQLSQQQQQQLQLQQQQQRQLQLLLQQQQNRNRTHGSSGKYRSEEAEALDNQWKIAFVEGAPDGMTGLDLLQELVKLRMRRACGRVRRSNTVNSILSLEHEMEENLISADFYKERHELLRDICRVYEGGIRRDTRRINELLELLARHMKRNDAQLSVQMMSVLSKRGGGAGASDDGSADDEADRRSYYASPYFYGNGLVKGGLFADRHLYVPVGTGAGSYIVFESEQVPVSAFYNPDGDEAAVIRSYSSTRTPYSAAMDYCNGVQRGMPIGDRFGPVFFKQDLSYHPQKDGNAHYYVADGEGRNLLRAAEVATHYGLATTSKLRGEANGAVPSPPLPHPATIPMTQILFPAPRPLPNPETSAAPSESPHPYVYHVAPKTLGEDGVPASKTDARESLEPVYLVPLTTPATRNEQARRGFGHTADSKLFAAASGCGDGETTPGAVPLAVSYAHLLDPTGGIRTGPPITAVPNPYLHEPPRVCRPPTEEQTLLRIESLQRPQPQPQQQEKLPPPHGPQELDHLTLSESLPFGGASPDNEVALTHSTPETVSAPLTVTVAADAAADSTKTVPLPPPAAATATTTSADTKGLASSSPASTPPPPATVPAPAALATFETALQRAKQQRAARLEKETAQLEKETERRKDSWTRGMHNPAETSHKEKFLRLRLPGSGRLAPIRPSVQDTTLIQRKIRLPSVPVSMVKTSSVDTVSQVNTSSDGSSDAAAAPDNGEANDPPPCEKDSAVTL